MMYDILIFVEVAVSVIRGIALQKIDIGEGGRGRKKYKYTMGSLLTRELGIGLGLSAGLCVAGYFRVNYQYFFLMRIRKSMRK